MEETSGSVTMCCPGNASKFAGGEAVVEEQGYRMLLEIEAMRQDYKDITWSRTLVGILLSFNTS